VIDLDRPRRRDPLGGLIHGYQLRGVVPLEELSGCATPRPAIWLGGRGDARNERVDDTAELASWIRLSGVAEEEEEVVDRRDQRGCERVGVGVGRDAPEPLLGGEVVGEGSSEHASLCLVFAPPRSFADRAGAEREEAEEAEQVRFEEGAAGGGEVAGDRSRCRPARAARLRAR
jgi:hypothetical protein